MSIHHLHCFDHDHLVGTISYDSKEDRFSFDYDASWGKRENAYPLSPYFPLNGQNRVGSTTIRLFLANLLPEGQALDIASVVAQISKNNIFGLVRELGSEPVGAFSFRSDNAPPDRQPPIRREITPDELSQRIRDRATMPLPVWDGRVRLSIAGFQDKLQVLVEGERMFLADGSLASTHILKPEPSNPNTPLMVANEHFCMTLAAQLGMPVAQVAIRRLPEPILLVQRFDREVIGDTVRRIHAIDGCQALDFPVSYKYEHNFGNGPDVRNIREGVSFERLFSLREHFSNPATAQRILLQWALLQFLLGNSDAHGKNISFFLSSGGLTPAPFYDLVAVSVYDGMTIDHELAMAFGDCFRLEEVSAFALADFAHRAGLDRRLVSREMIRLADLARQVAPALAEDAIYIDDEREMVERIAAFVDGQAQKMLALAPQILKVNPDLL